MEDLIEQIAETLARAFVLVIMLEALVWFVVIAAVGGSCWFVYTNRNQHPIWALSVVAIWALVATVRIIRGVVACVKARR